MYILIIKPVTRSITGLGVYYPLKVHSLPCDPIRMLSSGRIR